MKRLSIMMVCLFIAMQSFAEGKIWIKVDASTINMVYFSFAKGAEKQQLVDKDWINEPAGYFKMVGNTLTRKTGSELDIAIDWYNGYQKTDQSGKWVAMTAQEKQAVDNSNKTAYATRLAQDKAIDSLRELINEKFGNASKQITQQELIDKIKTK